MEAKTLLEEAQRGGFWSYIAGVAYQVMTNYHVRGLVIGTLWVGAVACGFAYNGLLAAGVF
jgi:hypothetical protein